MANAQFTLITSLQYENQNLRKRIESPKKGGDTGICAGMIRSFCASGNNMTADVYRFRKKRRAEYVFYRFAPMDRGLKLLKASLTSGMACVRM